MPKKTESKAKKVSKVTKEAPKKALIVTTDPIAVLLATISKQLEHLGNLGPQVVHLLDRVARVEGTHNALVLELEKRGVLDKAGTIIEENIKKAAAKNAEIGTNGRGETKPNEEAQKQAEFGF